MELTSDEREALSLSQGFAVATTPYFASLMNTANPDCPIRRQVIPSTKESWTAPNTCADPLAEASRSPVQNIIHRYPDRLVLIVTETCNMYCRHCTRRRLVGFTEGEVARCNITDAIEYIRAHSEVRDVLISGGDPLVLGDEKLEEIIREIRQISHVEVIRIGTRAPITNPFRITPELVEIIKKYHPIWVNVQFNHYKEITPEATYACGLLTDGGIPIGNQTVLLKGINDSIEVQKKLVQQLVQIRVRPYYLYQCDLTDGVEHFRTPVARGIEIIENLRGYTSGFAVPTFVIDAPGGGGKIPVMPQYVISQSPEKIVLRNYEGKIFTYPEPQS